MRAVAIEQFGEAPRLMELPAPEPRPEEVLVRLEAASVNPIDWQVAAGAFQAHMQHSFPLILGFDGAGRVEALGEHTQRFAVGDVVFGQFWSHPLGKGTLAEYVAIPEQPANGAIGPIPDGVSMAVAAALPTAGMAALGAVDATGCGPETTILIIGATGGVGSFATQIAAKRGAHVIATARPDAHQWIRRLGASETVDHSNRPIADALQELHPDGIDTLLDLVGDQQLVAAAAPHVRDGGVALSVAFGIPSQLKDDTRITCANYMVERKPQLLHRIGEQTAAANITAEIQGELALNRAPTALAANRAGGARGKTVIRIV